MRRVLLLLLFLTVFVLPAHALPRYIFLFIGDGLGQEEIDLYKASVPQASFSAFPVHVLLGNLTADGRIPDSAASATSIACGVKTKEGTLAQDASGRPAKSIAQEAKENGLRVGIITNVALNDATPAAFYAHASSRRNYDEIAQQLIESGFDLFVGSGIATSTREKREEILHHAQAKGYSITRDFQEFTSFKGPLPLLALLPFTFAIDRKETSPTLSQCVRKAIELLQGPRGFLLVIEGGRIDWCNHMNDIASSLKELEEFDAAIWEALSFGKKHPEETLVLVTADHETGGLRLKRKPSPVALRQKGSYERFFTELAAVPFEKETLRQFISSFWEEESEIEEILANFLASKDEKTLWISLARLFAEKAGISWSTTGHAALLVPLYAWGEGALLFAGATENTDIARILREEVVSERVF
ncbi:MAG: alkaline phosphatase [Candidatus Caldatribacterium sp.]|nr:alkaline phosphatase [Candidatus Caldatribacterium sp.]